MNGGSDPTSTRAGGQDDGSSTNSLKLVAHFDKSWTRKTVVMFMILFPDISLISVFWGLTNSKCRSRRISTRGLSGAFGTNSLRRVSIEDLFFSPDGATATLTVNQDSQKIDLEAHIHHSTFLEEGKGASIVEGYHIFSQRILTYSKDFSKVRAL